jgi:DNA-directed RNA polymerase specialized sigma24 family protein
VSQQLPNDADIVARLVEGDKEGLVCLYDEYAGLIYGVALRVLRNAAAEDVVQEVFLQLWRACSGGHPNDNRQSKRKGTFLMR